MIGWQAINRFWNAPKREAEARSQLDAIGKQLAELRAENARLLILVRALRDVNASLDQRLLGIEQGAASGTL